MQYYIPWLARPKNAVSLRLSPLRVVKKFSLIWIAVFSTASSTCCALEESFALPFMALGKTLMAARQLPVEVTSTQAIYLKEGNVLPLPGTQCMYTGGEREQVCFGNNPPTRLRLQPGKSLKLGLSSQSISRLRYTASLPSPPEPLPPQVIFPEADSGSKAVATEIQLGVERQDEITKNAKQTIELWLHRIPEEFEVDEHEIEWWELLKEDSEVTDDFDKADSKFEELLHERMLLKPDTCYRIIPASYSNAQTGGDVCCDNETGNGKGQKQTSQQQNADSKNDGSEKKEGDSEEVSSEKKEGDSKKASSVADDADCLITEVEPGFYVSPEVTAYCDGLDSKVVKQEPESDNEMIIGTELTVAAEADSTTDDLDSTTDDLDSPPPPRKRKMKHVCDRLGADGKPCKKGFNRADLLTRHINDIHEPKGKHVCDRTGADGQPCKRAFKSADALKTHIKEVHEGKNRHVCDWPGEDGQPCKQTCSRAHGLKRHMKRVHGVEEVYICDRTRADGKPCRRVYFRACDLKGHIEQEHIEDSHESKNRHVCDWAGEDGQPCKQTFSRAHSLKRHIKSGHGVEEEYICDRTRAGGKPCRRAYFRACDLKGHIEQEHIEDSHESKKKHVCDWPGEDGQPCKKAFVRAHLLESHIKGFHEGKKEHVCDRPGKDGESCNAGFSSKHELRRHIRDVHGGKRKHVCDWPGKDGEPCNAGFYRAHNLQAHIREIHEGKKRPEKRPRIEEVDD